MKKSVFNISQMDCPSEENLIRMKLGSYTTIEHLDFDLGNRTLSVFHTDQLDQITKSLEDLKLGTKLLSTEESTQSNFGEQSNQRSLLLSVLAINFLFFLIEMVFGLVSKSMGLIADSLDMLADAFVYGISLFAIGSTVARKKKVATLAGYFQLLLAGIGFIEVVRRFFNNEHLPNYETMIVVSLFALVANAICLYLLQRSKSKEEVHMKASLIFTSNDVIINLGVIIAALLVMYFDSALPDLIIGCIVFILVSQGARRILRLGR